MPLDDVPSTGLSAGLSPPSENVPAIPGAKSPTPSPEELHEMRMAQASGLGSLPRPIQPRSAPDNHPAAPPSTPRSAPVRSSIRGDDSPTVFAAKLMGIPVLTLLAGLGISGVAGSQPLESLPPLPDGAAGLDGPHLWLGIGAFLIQMLVSLADRWLNARRTDVDALRTQVAELTEKIESLQQQRSDLQRANDALEIRLEVARDKLNDSN